jgi:putative flippase GtrA
MFANVGGYCTGLLVSFVGQSRLTFASANTGALEFTKFALTSLTGFVVNALAYDALLRWTGLDYRFALLLVLLAVAALTYLSMSRWVFLRPRRIA